MMDPKTGEYSGPLPRERYNSYFQEAIYQCVIRGDEKGLKDLTDRLKWRCRQQAKRNRQVTA